MMSLAELRTTVSMAPCQSMSAGGSRSGAGGGVTSSGSSVRGSPAMRSSGHARLTQCSFAAAGFRSARATSASVSSTDGTSPVKTAMTSHSDAIAAAPFRIISHRPRSAGSVEQRGHQSCRARRHDCFRSDRRRPVLGEHGDTDFADPAGNERENDRWLGVSEREANCVVPRSRRCDDANVPIPHCEKCCAVTDGW